MARLVDDSAFRLRSRGAPAATMWLASVSRHQQGARIALLGLAALLAAILIWRTRNSQPGYVFVILAASAVPIASVRNWNPPRATYLLSVPLIGAAVTVSIVFRTPTARTTALVLLAAAAAIATFTFMARIVYNPNASSRQAHISSEKQDTD